VVYVRNLMLIRKERLIASEAPAAAPAGDASTTHATERAVGGAPSRA